MHPAYLRGEIDTPQWGGSHDTGPQVLQLPALAPDWSLTDRIRELEARVEDLLATNNRYLQHARDARAIAQDRGRLLELMTKAYADMARRCAELEAQMAARPGSEALPWRAEV